MTTAAPERDAGQVDERTNPPFLRRVRIRGYKSIGFCDVALGPLTILVGRNGAGKSNFLDALAFLRDVVLVGLTQAVKRHGGADAIPCRLQQDRVVSIETECDYSLGDAASWHATYRIDVDFSKAHSARLSREELRVEQGEWWLAYVNEGERVTCRASDDVLRERTWKANDRPFLDASDDTSVTVFARYLEAITTYNFNPEAIRLPHPPARGDLLERDGSNLAGTIAGLKEIDKEAVERIRDYLMLINEDVRGFDVATYGDEYETVRFDLGAQQANFTATSMSDGTLRALAALVAAFQVNSSVVGIEEPETSLHPAAMRALVDAMDEATSRTQILLTTHSAELLAGRDVTPGHVLVVRNRGGLTQITPVDPASREIVEKELYSLADLQRMDQLDLDEADLKRQARLSNGTAGE